MKLFYLGKKRGVLRRVQDTPTNGFLWCLKYDKNGHVCQLQKIEKKPRPCLTLSAAFDITAKLWWQHKNPTIFSCNLLDTIVYNATCAGVAQ